LIKQKHGNGMITVALERLITTLFSFGLLRKDHKQSDTNCSQMTFIEQPCNTIKIPQHPTPHSIIAACYCLRQQKGDALLQVPPSFKNRSPSSSNKWKPHFIEFSRGTITFDQSGGGRLCDLGLRAFYQRARPLFGAAAREERGVLCFD
jgi:hypothetical protein